MIDGNCNRINIKVARKGSNIFGRSPASKGCQDVKPTRLGGEQCHKC